jgi:1-acyl-sn-glycerol-3-phosphate acyltransferase
MAYHKGSNIIGFTPGFLPFIVLYRFVLTLVRIFDALVYRLRITGRENLRVFDRAVLVSNHTMLLDPGIIAHAISPRRTYFTMLEDTALIPFLGTFVRLLGGVPIPERPGALLMLDAAAREALSHLGLIHFFPEGECYRGSQVIQPFHPGAFLLACRLSAPIIPVTTVLHERRWRGVRLPPRVTIVIGEAVHPPLVVLPSAPGQRSGISIKGAARALSLSVRESMQQTIDREGGSRTLYRGMMPRLVKHAGPAAQPAAAEERPARVM